MSNIEENAFVYSSLYTSFTGLEHVVEIRFEGRKEPHYECKLCGFNTEMAPMIEHLSGYKHRRAYIVSNFDAF